jgi:serine protease Do
MKLHLKTLFVFVLIAKTNTVYSQSYLTVSNPGYVFFNPTVDFSNAVEMSGKKVECIEYIPNGDNDGIFKVWIGNRIGYLFRGHVVYNDDYYSIMNNGSVIKSQDVENIKAEESELKKSLTDISATLSNEVPISPSISTDVRASIKEKITETGNKELNLHVEYFYEVVKAQMELKTDDYPAGFYTLNSSNAATLTANFIKKTLENNLKKYITPSRKISIVITGSTDASPIGSKLLYTGEFGNISDKLYFSDGALQSINLMSNDPVQSNSQLAFLRTQGLKSYIETSIPVLKQASLNFEQRAIVSKGIGAEFRRISVEIVIHDAFQKKSESSKQDLTQLYLKCKNSVFRIISNDRKGVSQGSGFFVNDKGIAISNYHVLNSSNFKSSFIVLEDGQEFKIDKVIEESNELDYSIFKVSNTSNIKFEKADISYLSSVIGESVFAIGNPMGLEKTLSEGIVSGFRNSEKYIQTTTPITFGSSGGPLFNKRGEVIGITTSGMGEGNLNFAINIKLLKIERFK